MHLGGAIGDIASWLSSNNGVLTPLGALGAAFGALGTCIAAIIAAIALWSQRRTSSWNSSRDCLWHFIEKHDSLRGSMREAEKELNEKKDEPLPEAVPSLDQILNFYESMAFMTNRSHCDTELTWHWFYEDFKRIWTNPRMEVYVANAQSEDMLLWCNLRPWYRSMDDLEKKHQERGGRLKKPRSIEEISAELSTTAGRLSATEARLSATAEKFAATDAKQSANGAHETGTRPPANGAGSSDSGTDTDGPDSSKSSPGEADSAGAQPTAEGTDSSTPKAP